MSMEFYNETSYVARKEYTCEMCGRKIQRGQRYIYQTGKWDGSFFTRRLHRQCELILMDYCSEVDNEFDWEGVIDYACEEYCSDCEHAGCNDDREGWTECTERVYTCPNVLAKLKDKYRLNG